MSGTKAGGLLARDRNRERHGEDYYKRLGKLGGSTPTTRPKGFAHAAANGLDWHKVAGQRGGTISRRKPKEV